MMDLVRLGFIGCGKIIRNAHINATLAEHEEVELVAYYDVVREAAEAYSGRALVIWGDADDVVPPTDSAWLLDHCGERTEAMRFDGGDHRLAAYVPEIADRISAFMAAALRDVR